MTEVYAAVEAIVQPDELSIASVCDVLGVCRSAYYAWRDGEPSRRDQREEALTPLIRAVFWKHQRRYGARRIVAELDDLGEAPVSMEHYFERPAFCYVASLPMPGPEALDSPELRRRIEHSIDACRALFQEYLED